LVDFDPQSPQELALKKILLTFENGVKEQDPHKVASLLHETASVMVGRERQILDKETYIKILAERLQNNSAVSLSKPKMKISGNRAEVKIYMKRGSNNTLVVFNFIRERDQWYIQSWQY